MVQSAASLHSQGRPPPAAMLWTAGAVESEFKADKAGAIQEWKHHSWTIAEKKLLSRQRVLTLPAFELWEGGTFRLIVKACPHNVKGGFQGSGGLGQVELKFCGRPEFAGSDHWSVAVGKNKELPLEGLDHYFATRPQSILQQELNLLSAVNNGSLLLHLETRSSDLHQVGQHGGCNIACQFPPALRTRQSSGTKNKQSV